jgi:hypothetical protein
LCHTCKIDWLSFSLFLSPPPKWWMFYILKLKSKKHFNCWSRPHQNLFNNSLVINRQCIHTFKLYDYFVHYHNFWHHVNFIYLDRDNFQNLCLFSSTTLHPSSHQRRDLLTISSQFSPFITLVRTEPVNTFLIHCCLNYDSSRPHRHQSRNKVTTKPKV